jgi:Uncharacterized conserved protein
MEEVPCGPMDIAITPDGSRAYVTNFGERNRIGRTVSVIDVETDTVIDVDPATPDIIDPVPVSKGPAGIAITQNPEDPPDIFRVYVTHLGGIQQTSFSSPGRTVSVISTATNTVVDQVDLVFDQDEPSLPFVPGGLGSWTSWYSNNFRRLQGLR